MVQRVRIHSNHTGLVTYSIVDSPGRTSIRDQVLQVWCERRNGRVWRRVQGSRLQRHPTRHHFLHAKRDRRLCAPDWTYWSQWQDRNCNYVCEHEYPRANVVGFEVSIDGSRSKVSFLSYFCLYIIQFDIAWQSTALLIIHRRSPHGTRWTTQGLPGLWRYVKELSFGLLLP